MQDAHDLDQVGPDGPVVDDMYRLIDPVFLASTLAAPDVQASQPSRQIIVLCGWQAGGILGDAAEGGGEECAIASGGCRAVLSFTCAQDGGDIGNGQS